MTLIYNTFSWNSRYHTTPCRRYSDLVATILSSPAVMSTLVP